MSGPSRTQRLFGALLITVGALMAALCGTCTVFFVGTGLVAWISQPQNYSASMIVIEALVIGGAPTVIGIALVIGGTRMRRLPATKRLRDLDNTFS